MFIKNFIDSVKIIIKNLCTVLQTSIHAHLAYCIIFQYIHAFCAGAIIIATRECSMFPSVIFSRAYEPNKHNALSLPRIFESKPNVIMFIRKARSLLNEIEMRAA